MSESNAETSVVTPATPSAGSTKRKRGEVNQLTADALDVTDKVCAAASDKDYKDDLLTEEITETFVADTAALSVECRQLMTGAHQDTTTRTGATTTETKARKLFIALLHDAQSRARQKHEDDAAETLSDYYVSTNLDNANFAQLKQISQSILEKLPNDALPGMTPAKIKALSAARQAWLDADTSQGTAQTSSGVKHGSLTEKMALLLARRRKIQLAADRIFPPGAKNAPIRRLFQLPVNRRFT